MKKIGLFLLIYCILGGGLLAEEMSTEQWLQLYDEYRAMFEEGAEAVRNGEAEPIKCATPFINALILSQPKDVAPVALYPGREDTMSFTYGATHFLLHYTGTGSNRVFEFDKQDSLPGTPNYIYNAGRILDSVWNHTVNEMGFTPPVSDGYYNGGGDGRLDVYFINFQAYGATVRDSIQATLPITTTTYMFLENDYEGFPGYESTRLDALRVSAAHEFFHSVQFAIDASELEGSSPAFNPAWIEMSAVYMEEEHYDHINDYYNYLLYFYDVPQWSIRTGTILGSPTINYWRNLHMYASVVFPLYLTERFGTGIIKDIWDGCGDVSGPNWWLATDDAILNLNNDTLGLPEAFQEFTVYNLFTKHRARPADFFSEGQDYDSVNLAARVTAYPATVAPIDSVQPDNLGANYIMLENTATQDSGLTISFDPDLSQRWGITIVGMQSNISLPVDISYIQYDTLSPYIRIPNASDYHRVALIVSVLEGNSVQADYSLTITPGGGGVVRPNGGEVWFADFIEKIIWFFEEVSDSVLIEFSSDNGQTWETVARVPNDLTYDWKVPNISSNQCLIRVTTIGDPAVSDVSDDVFTIGIPENTIWEPFPNPAWPDRRNHEAVRFKATYSEGAADVREGMSVTIMTLAGEKIKELEAEPEGGLALAEWDYTNEDGRTVAAGPYLAIIKFLGETHIKKFVVLR